MNIIESIKVAIGAVVSNKLRSLLTMLGIIIGISSVITIVSLGEGAKKQMIKEISEATASGKVISMNWAKDIAYEDYMKQGDVALVESIFSDEIEYIIAQSYNEANLVNNRQADVSGKKYDKLIALIDANEASMKGGKVNIIKGRGLLDQDIIANRRVGVIEERTAEEIFSGKNAIGEDIFLSIQGYSNIISLKIVGVYKEPKALLLGEGSPSRGKVYVPTSISREVEGDNSIVSQINIQLKEGIEDEDKILNRIISFIETRHNNVGEETYMIESLEDMSDMINSTIGIIASVISAIAAISLLVGGIGVMNIMFVSVTERTREIGIRKAIGARKKDILVQFLVEAVIISGIGGIIGTGLGIGIAFIVSSIIGLPTVISIKSIIVASLFSCGVGVFFGLYPANKAAKLDPIIALRFE